MVLGAHDRLPNLWPGPVSHTHLVINNILNLHGSSLGARRLEPPPPQCPDVRPALQLLLVVYCDAVSTHAEY